MDVKKTGTIIAEARKQLGYTQKELGDKLNVSNTTVSKWEGGTRFPDVSLLAPLAKELNLTVNELLTGEKEADSEESLKTLVDVSKEEVIYKNRKTILRVSLVSAVLVTLISGLVLYLSGLMRKPSYIEGIWYDSDSRQITLRAGVILNEADKTVGSYSENGAEVHFGETWNASEREMYYYRFNDGTEILTEHAGGTGKTLYARGGKDAESSWNNAVRARTSRFKEFLQQNLVGIWETEEAWYIDSLPYWKIAEDGTIYEMDPDRNVCHVLYSDFYDIQTRVNKDGQIVMPNHFGDEPGQLIYDYMEIKELPDTYTKNEIEMFGIRFHKKTEP
ncbi:MAG: helix-turn-helix transcriptional regulator [Erysipelotrichales bacterium]|nr:helix-turn-helix transcriptional regulator [Erysipelotrichales bacterium]